MKRMVTLLKGCALSLLSVLPLAAQVYEHEDPAARAEWRHIMRSNEDGSIDMGALLRAKEELDQKRAFAKTGAPDDAGISGWTWLGPSNIGGRIRSILIHPTDPDTMWIGSVSGGIWKTLDGGTTWAPLNDFLPSLAVSSMVMDPFDPDVIYAATGEGFGNADALLGVGVFKTENGGITWSLLPSTTGLGWSQMTRLAHDPTADGILFATEKDSGVRRSLDWGQSWTIVYNTGANFRDVKVHPTDGDLIVTAGDGFVAFSDDGGDQWTDITPVGASGRRIEIGLGVLDQGASLTTYLYALSSSPADSLCRLWLQNATNLNYNFTGNGWSLQNNTQSIHQGVGDQTWYDNAIWVDPIDPTNIVAGGVRLWRSTNSGLNLELISDGGDFPDGPTLSPHSDQHIILQHPDYDGSGNATVFVGNDGGIQKANDIFAASTSGGWENVGLGLGITQFYAGAAATDGSLVTGGTQDNGTLIYRSIQGADDWEIGIGNSDGGWTAVHPTNPDIVYGETQFLGFRKSTDGGQTFVPAINGLTEAGNNALAPFVAAFSMAPSNPNVLVACGTSIWRTVDAASSWSVMRPAVSGNPKCSAVDIGSTTSSYVWVGYTNGHVAYTANGGTTWTRVDDNPSLLPGRAVTDIAIDPNEPNRAFVTFGGNLSDSIFMTEDFGSSWTQRTGTLLDNLPSIQVNSVRFHPDNTDWLYASTDLGVFASDNLGETWSEAPWAWFVGHEGPINTEVAELFWQNDFLVAATHGRGMYRTRPSVVYVDQSFGSGGNGLKATPFDTVDEALVPAGPGSTIHLGAGEYNGGAILIDEETWITTSGGSVVIR